jgi:small-conductance mechanosensitive channel
VKNGTELLPRLLEAMRLENMAVAICLMLLLISARRLFLRTLARERSKNLDAQERGCLRWALATLALVAMFLFADARLPDHARIDALLGAFGLLAVGVGFLWSARLIRLAAFVGSFLLSPKRPVPLLLINVVTFLVATGFALLVAKVVLGFSVMPLLATSAVLSLVLGLAMQDTLGNLITGIALQIDKPFRIGDWIELQGGGLKTVGKVLEVTWRATVLRAFSDEVLVVPNRIVAQSQISNYSDLELPVLRSHAFRFPFGTNLNLVRLAFLEVVARTPGIHADPPPLFLVIDNGESWVNTKLLYSVEEFGDQFVVGDKVLVACHDRLERMGIPLAKPAYDVVTRPPSPSRDSLS